MNHPQFWILSAGKDGELWPAFWREKKIAIGWPAIGDLTRIASREALQERYAKIWPNESRRAQATGVSQIWRFYRALKKGDLVFIRSYVALIGVALVDGDYEFLGNTSPLRQKFRSQRFDEYWLHVRSVRWISLGGGMKQPLSLTRLTVM
jgi:predicted Mrr-cat superfamily restriction endonuclease